MSHPRANFNVHNPEIGVDQEPPQSSRNQAPRGANFVDGSGQIFSMYLEMANEEDKKMVENWKADADGILIFTGLFSAAVASLLSVTIQDIQENPQDTSNFYLANIYHATINSESNGPSILSSPPASPPPFSPPNSAVWVNALWFLSLVISLTCALLATLLQQWARRYLKITQSRYSLHKQARVRAFFSEGVEKCLLPWTVETLPALLHISLFLFFAGLVVFLCNVNLTIFKLVLSWVGLCTAFYGCITCMPIFRHDSPYYTPLSLLAWNIVTGIPFLVYRFLRWFNQSVRYRNHAFFHFRHLEECYHKLLVQGMQKTAEETALNLQLDIDTRAFMWTFDCLDEDHELEHFFSGLPGFRSSDVVDDPLPSLTREQKWKLYEALIGLLYRTFSSEFLPVHVKNRRAMICAKALDPDHIPNALNVLDTILYEYQYSGPLATGTANILRGWGPKVSENNICSAQLAISKVIATRQPYDDSWYILAFNELGIPEATLRDYAAHGDDLSLIILMHVVRQQFNHFWQRYWEASSFSFILAEASKLEIKDTSPELQHQFCGLWNQVVREVQDSDDQSMAFRILGQIRNVFLALHQDTDSAPTLFSTTTDDEDRILGEPSSYPVCKVPGHRTDSTLHIHGNDISISTITACAILRDPNLPAFIPSLASPAPPSSSTLPVNETFTDAQRLNNQIYVPVYAQPIGETMTESRRIPASLPSSVATCKMHRSTNPSSSLRTIHPSVSEPLTSSPPPKSNTSASRPDGAAIGHTTLRCTPSGDLNVLCSHSPTPLLDDMPLTEPHSSILATVPEEESSAKAAFSMPVEKDASYSTSAIRKDFTASADLLPHLPSPSQITDVAINSPSTRSLGTKYIERRPLDPAHSPYDIV